MRETAKELGRKVKALEEDLAASIETRRRLEKLITSETEARQTLEDFVALSPFTPRSTNGATPVRGDSSSFLSPPMPRVFGSRVASGGTDGTGDPVVRLQAQVRQTAVGGLPMVALGVGLCPKTRG